MITSIRVVKRPEGRAPFLSWVKVTRKTGASAKLKIFTVDISDKAQSENNLWLQDGDVIEVQEK